MVIEDKIGRNKNVQKFDNYYRRITKAWGTKWVADMGILSHLELKKHFRDNETVPYREYTHHYE